LGLQLEKEWALTELFRLFVDLDEMQEEHVGLALSHREFALKQRSKEFQVGDLLVLGGVEHSEALEVGSERSASHREPLD